MLEGINYLHAKFQIDILKNKKVIKLFKHWNSGLRKKREKNSEIKSVVIQH